MGERQGALHPLSGQLGGAVLAGLALRWHNLLTCTILTRPANDSMAGLHDRMPVILNIEEREAWLSGSEDPGLGAEAKLRHFPVRPFGMADEGPELIEPLIEPLEGNPQRRLI